MDLWKRGLDAGLVGDTEAEGSARDGRAASRGKEEEEDEAVSRSYHETVFSGKLSPAINQATNRKWGESILPYDQCKKNGRPVAEVIRENHPDMQIPPMENPTCAAFKEYGEVL